MMKHTRLNIQGCAPEVLNGLPKNSQVRGNMVLGGCTGLTSLPKGMMVKGFIFARGSGIDLKTCQRTCAAE